MKKKMPAALLSLLLCAILPLSGCGKKDEPEDTGPARVKIGIFEPLTGQDAAWGEAEKLGIEYAHSLAPTVRIGGKDVEVELVTADNAGSVTFAEAAAKLLVDQEVSVVLGSYGTEVSVQAGPVFEQAGVAAVGLSCGGGRLTSGNDYYFTLRSPEELHAAALARYAFNRLNVQKVRCLGVAGDELTVRRINAFTQAFEALGGQASADYMPDQDPDLVTFLVRGYDEGAEAFFAPLDTAGVMRMATLCRSLEIYVPILGPDELDDDELLTIPVDEESTAPAIRIYVSSLYAAGGSESFDQGLRDYVGYQPEGDGSVPDPVSSYAALGYDAYNLALKAMQNTGSVDKADILAVMPGVIYTGVTGKLYFDEEGTVRRDAVYVKRADYVNGRWRLDRRQAGSD